MSIYRHDDLNKGVGCVPGASASLGYCLGVYITVWSQEEKVLGLSVVSVPMSHFPITFNLVRSGTENHSPTSRFQPRKLGPQNSALCVSPWVTFLSSSELCHK